MDQRIFTEVFKEIVSRIRSIYDAENLIFPAYIYGHYQAIADELAEKASSDYSGERYPLIILGIDNEYIENEISDGVYDVSFNCWIVQETKKEFFTEDRFEQVYKTYLYPLYKLLKQELVNSEMIGALGVSELSASVKLIPYWGTTSQMRSEQAYVNDPLDAIEIKFSNLEVYYDNC